MYLEDSNVEMTMDQEYRASLILKEYSNRSNNNLKAIYSLNNYEQYVSNNPDTFLLKKEMDADFTMSELTIAFSQLKQSPSGNDFIHTYIYT